MRRVLLTAVPAVLLLSGIIAWMMLVGSHQRHDAYVRSHSRTFGYIHYETTGITTYLLDHGKEIPVEFSNTSSRSAVESFCALKWNVEAANANGKRVFLMGYLHPRLKWTPNAPNMAKSEQYQEFALQQWYIVSPFMELVESDDGAVSSRKRKRTNLSRDDFTPFAGRETFNVSEHIRGKR